MKNGRTLEAATVAGASAPVSASVVVPFRPRDQVPRRLIVSTPAPRFASLDHAPCVVDGRVVAGDLIRALQAGGFDFAYDKRTGSFRIMRAEDAAKERQP